MNSLIDKYNIPGPRYTSYPTVPYWDENSFTPELWKQSVIRTFKKVMQKRDFHIHSPSFLRGFMYVLRMS
jgi:oxygen-independent coproporphyrinogen-3 oxidase